jgi:hypothetical protein
MRTTGIAHRPLPFPQRSAAATVDEYIAEAPLDRLDALSLLRRLCQRNCPASTRP